MNKKQFYTAGQHHDSGIVNPRRHKFSNFVGLTQNAPNHINQDMHTEDSRNMSRDNKSIRHKTESAMGEGLAKKDLNQMGKNAKISEISRMQDSIPATHEEVVHLKSNSSSDNKTPVFPSQQKQVQKTKMFEKCVICGTLTEKCCGLCRRVFYCTAEHQEIDWHTRHKVECLGRAHINHQRSAIEKEENEDAEPNNKFIFYSNTNKSNNDAYEKELEYQSVQRFLELLEQRLILRSKIMGQAVKINERTAAIVRESLVRQSQELLELSERITHQEFKPSFSRKITKKDILEYSSQQWGSQVTVSENGVALQYYADLVLMAKLYHLCGFIKQTREAVIAIGRLLQDPEQKILFLSNEMSKYNTVQARPGESTPLKKLGINSQYVTGVSSGKGQHPDDHIIRAGLGRIEDPLYHSKKLILQSILQLSEYYNIDKTSQSVYKLYIKKIEIEQGVWQQIYGYFNIGVWYMKRTYFDKSIKSFTYSLELLDSHKKGSADSAVFKADCLFNIGQGYWALGEKQLAIQTMQESYKVRVNTIGKNSMECSYCLYSLAKWYRDLEKWGQCLQYMDECLRIRKLYEAQPIFQGKLEQIKQLIVNVNKAIKAEKKRTQEKLDPKSTKYFSQILQKEQEEQKRRQQRSKEEKQLLPKGTVASRLFRQDKEYVNFKVNVSIELWDTISSNQAKYLGDLLELSDKKMEKHEAIRILTESPFVESLTPEQRDQFMSENNLKPVSP